MNFTYQDCVTLDMDNFTPPSYTIKRIIKDNNNNENDSMMLILNDSSSTSPLFFRKEIAMKRSTLEKLFIRCSDKNPIYLNPYDYTTRRHSSPLYASLSELTRNDSLYSRVNNKKHPAPAPAPAPALPDRTYNKGGTRGKNMQTKLRKTIKKRRTRSS
jgi:hypothetical protein